MLVASSRQMPRVFKRDSEYLNSITVPVFEDMIDALDGDGDFDYADYDENIARMDEPEAAGTL